MLLKINHNDPRHDAIFTKKFDGNILEWWPGEGAVSINDPIGATFSPKNMTVDYITE